MAWKQANFERLAKFNSSNSSDLIQIYEDSIDKKITAKNAEPKNRTFSPSSFRCPRYSWFKIRGVNPDKIKSPDRGLQFTADVGTSCHEIIQGYLSTALGEDWIDVEQYLKSKWSDKKYTVDKNGYETRVHLESPPVRFACDGIVRINDKLFLLEIKTSDFSSFNELTDPKPQHRDQIKFYCTLLGLDNALVLYQDRQYGSVKCYEVKITENDKNMILNRIQNVLECVESNIAPDRLDWSDSWCSQNMCAYYSKCHEWG